MTLLVASSAASGEARAPISFDSVEAIDLGSASPTFAVRNDTLDDLTVTVSIETNLASSAGISFGDPLAGQDTGELELSSAETVTVPLVVGTLADSLTSATLLATTTHDGADLVLRRTLSLPSNTVEPAFESWSFTVYEWSPVYWWSGFVDWGDAFPLENESCDGISPQSGSLRSDRHRVTVTAICRSDPPRMQISFGDFPTQAGQYDGTLEFGDTKVAISVRRTVAVLWPLLTILLGLGAALWQRGWITNRRSPKRLLAALHRLIDQARMADEKAHHGLDSAVPRHSITEGVEGMVKVQEALVESLNPRRGLWSFLPFADDYDNDALDTAAKAAVEAKAVISGWADYAALAKDARSKLDAGRFNRSAPSFAEALRSVLDGEPRTLTLEEASDALGLLRSVEAADRAITELEALEGALRQHATKPDERLAGVNAKAVANVNAAKQMLDRAATTATIEAVVAQLAVARSFVDQLGPPPPPPPPPPTFGAGRAAVVRPLTPAVQRALAAARARRRVRELAAETYARDAAIGMLAAFVAATTGLHTLYIGKAWGSPVDYLWLFTWALVTTSVLTPLFDSVERMATSRLGPKPPEVSGDRASP